MPHGGAGPPSDLPFVLHNSQCIPQLAVASGLEAPGVAHPPLFDSIPPWAGVPLRFHRSGQDPCAEQAGASTLRVAQQNRGSILCGLRCLFSEEYLKRSASERHFCFENGVVTGRSRQVLELENKNEKIIAFAWEPNGHRFCCIHGEGPRPDVSFYTMRDGANYKAPPAPLG